MLVSCLFVLNQPVPTIFLAELLKIPWETTSNSRRCFFSMLKAGFILLFSSWYWYCFSMICRIFTENSESHKAAACSRDNKSIDSSTTSDDVCDLKRCFQWPLAAQHPVHRPLTNGDTKIPKCRNPPSNHFIWTFLCLLFPVPSCYHGHDMTCQQCLGCGACSVGSLQEY